MKSYTDLEQSKKLAEILPSESADMHYWKRTWREGDYVIGVGHSKELQEGLTSKGIEYIPCWSLAVLFSILPHGTRLLKSATYNTYHCDCPKGNVDKWFDNPIDACYEMIIKLYELKML